jgi:propanol-preferring alcohol dehydrogenase
MAEALAFAVEGRVKADIELQPLSAINDIFKRMEDGDVAARVVIDYVGKPEAANKSELQEVYAN